MFVWIPGAPHRSEISVANVGAVSRHHFQPEHRLATAPIASNKYGQPGARRRECERRRVVSDVASDKAAIERAAGTIHVPARCPSNYFIRPSGF
jgi:hypothetical protein